MVDNPAEAYQEVQQLATRKVVKDRSYAGFNPAHPDDVALFAAVVRGDHLLKGFYYHGLSKAA